MSVLALDIQDNKKKKLYDIIKEDSYGSDSYYILVALAAIVATLGLLMNSSAIIIGAMLISPIMSPIIGISLSITLGDSELFSKAIKSLIFGSLLALIISIVISLFFPVHALTSEILSRTNPTVIDLIVALASGAAGAFTMCYKKGGAVLPGVAIATALMPPLCVTGTGIVYNSYSVALGGALLFLANLIAINLASALIFRLSGFTTHDEIDSHTKVKKRLMISITAFIIISIPLSFIMYKTITQQKINYLIEDTLKQNIISLKSTDLVNYSYLLKDNKYSIEAIVRSIDAISGDDIRSIENSLESKLGKPSSLTMKVILTQQVDALTKVEDKKEDISPNEKVQESKPPTTTENINADKTIEYAVAEKLKLFNFSLVSYDFSYQSQSAAYTINIFVDGTQEQLDSLKPTIVNVLEDKLNRKVNLTINLVPKVLEPSIPNFNNPKAEDDMYKTSQ